LLHLCINKNKQQLKINQHGNSNHKHLGYHIIGNAGTRLIKAKLIQAKNKRS